MTYFSRREWGARYRPDKAVPWSKRDHMVVHHTVHPGITQAAEVPTMVNIEADHHDNWGFSVGYNELVSAASANVFEGCGIERRGQHAPGFNTRGIGLALLGDGRKPPSDRVMVAMRRRYEIYCALTGRELVILGHRDTKQTVCPGDLLYSWVRAGMPLPTHPGAPTEGNVTTKNAIKATASGRGYWIVGSDGGVFCFGDAKFHGSLPGLHPEASVDNIVDIAPLPDGSGYWLLGSDGGVFAFGAAEFLGRP